MRWRRALALYAILPVAAAGWFVVFWRWFEFWRERRRFAYAAMAATFSGSAAAVYAARRYILAGRLRLPRWARRSGWLLMAASTVLGTVADRQIGFRVRSFAPFFDDSGRVVLKTDKAYGIVRHPIYAAGSGFQLGTFLVTGYPAVFMAWAVFTRAARWFTAEEEKRLALLLDDPAEYDRYRQRVPALLPGSITSRGR